MSTAPDLSGQHVLVTGGAGFVGRHVVTALLGAGARVRVADLDGHDEERVEVVAGDLREPDVRARAVDDTVTGIVHLAASTRVLESVEQPVAYHRNNVEVTAGLLELARDHGVERFTLASTNAVVGDVGHTEITEDTPIRPLSPYGATKAAGEMLLSGYAGAYGLRGVSLRFSNVYGPGMHAKDSLVPRLMRAARDGTGVEVYGDGHQVRDLVHVGDVVGALLAAWTSEHVGPLVVGAGTSHTVLELVEAARAATGRPIPVTHTPPRRGEMPAVRVSIDRARALGFRPTWDLARGMAGMWPEFADTAPAR